jgi:hypothetical protein
VHRVRSVGLMAFQSALTACASVPPLPMPILGQPSDPAEPKDSAVPANECCGVHQSHQNCTGPRQAVPGELIGLQAITDALAEIIGFRSDNATTCRWLAVGVRGHRIAGRRLGRRWACTRSALVAWARESGAIGGEA